MLKWLSASLCLCWQSLTVGESLQARSCPRRDPEWMSGRSQWINTLQWEGSEMCSTVLQKRPQEDWDPIPPSPSTLITALFIGLPPFFVSHPHHLTVLSGTTSQRNYWYSNIYLGFSFWQKPPILVSSDCCNKIPQTGWLKQQKLIFSQSWRLEVQDHGVVRVGF